MATQATDIEIPDIQPSKPNPTHNKNMIKIITDRLLLLLVDEVNKPDTQKLIRQKIIAPVITLLYNELYPYIIALACIIMVLLVLSVLTFTGFLIYYLKNL